jgi:catechol 2,3-dioxygenase-like lactoylglutathione lyase family enzyme
MGSVIVVAALPRAAQSLGGIMDASADSSPRRAGATAVHSLHRFVFSVPHLRPAVDFYSDFGLDARQIEKRVDLHTFGNEHRWGSIFEARGPKRLEYVSFSCYPEDYKPIVARLVQQGIALGKPHPLADEDGTWFVDPDGTPVQLVVGGKVSPSSKIASSPHATKIGTAAAPSRSTASKVRPRRLSHILLFASDVPRSVRFYCDTLGLRLSDYSGEIIAFLHGAHASDHHLIAFAKSDGPGLHHSSWDVASLDDVGLGMQQMQDRGHPHGWGVGRHVLGSNYFRYVRDPWGSFAEYSYDIDFIPEDSDWQAKDHPPEDSFYVWGPPVPDDFIINHESAARLPS